VTLRSFAEDQSGRATLRARSIVTLSQQRRSCWAGSWEERYAEENNYDGFDIGDCRRGASARLGGRLQVAEQHSARGEAAHGAPAVIADRSGRARVSKRRAGRVAEAKVAALALLGKEAPPCVSVPTLRVKKANLLSALKQVTKEDPPASLIKLCADKCF
jgi:hypothetical protein